MNRTIVEVVKIRIRDVVPGDVVNKDPGATKGWFDVVELRRLHDGSVTVASRVAQLSFSGYPDDIVGLQVLESRTVPDRVRPSGRPPGGDAPSRGPRPEGDAAAPRPPAEPVPATAGPAPRPDGPSGGASGPPSPARPPAAGH